MDENKSLTIASGNEMTADTMTGQGIDIFDTEKMGQAMKLAETISRSALIPNHFRGKPADCFIALYRAARLGLDPFGFMEQTYVVHGKLGVQAQFVAAMINSSRRFGPLMYEKSMDNNGETNGCRAWAKSRETGEPIYGPWVTRKMVDAEGWNKPEPIYEYQGGNRVKAGDRPSKWESMPDLMYQYRAASFFGRTNCSDIMLGIRTVDELRDSPAEVEERHSLFGAAPGDAVTEPAPKQAAAPVEHADSAAPEEKSQQEKPAEYGGKPEQAADQNGQTSIPLDGDTAVGDKRAAIAKEFGSDMDEFNSYCQKKKYCRQGETFSDVPDPVVDRLYATMKSVKKEFAGYKKYLAAAKKAGNR